MLGTPSLDDYYAISSQRSRDYLRALPFKKKQSYAAMFPGANPLALDLLERSVRARLGNEAYADLPRPCRCLTFNPAKRISVEDALSHPYLEPYHDPEDEPTAEVLRKPGTHRLSILKRLTEMHEQLRSSFILTGSN